MQLGSPKPDPPKIEYFDPRAFAFIKGWQPQIERGPGSRDVCGAPGDEWGLNETKPFNIMRMRKVLSVSVGVLTFFSNHIVQKSP